MYEYEKLKSHRSCLWSNNEREKNRENTSQIENSTLLNDDQPKRGLYAFDTEEHITAKNNTNSET